MTGYQHHTAFGLLSLGLLGGLSGCLSTKAPPGEVVALTCHGGEWSSCFSQADRACTSGTYQLINQITDAGSNALGNNESLIRANFIQRTLVIRCTDGEGPSEEQDRAQQN